MRHLKPFNLYIKESVEGKIDPEIQSAIQSFIDDYEFHFTENSANASPEYPTYICLKVELTEELIRQLMRLKTKVKLINRTILLTVYTLKNDRIEHQVMDYYSMNYDDVYDKLRELVAKPTVLDWHKSYVYMEIHIE